MAATNNPLHKLCMMRKTYVLRDRVNLTESSCSSQDYNGGKLKSKSAHNYNDDKENSHDNTKAQKAMEGKYH